MKSGWKSKKLGELAKIELGRTPPRASKAFWDEKRETRNIWLSIADLLSSKNKIVVDSKEYVTDRGAAICKLVPKGTLLVSFKLTLGRLAFAGCDLYTNEAIAALTLLNEHELSKEYLFWFLQFFDWVKAAENDVKLKGMTMNKAKLKEIDVHFPKSLSEQQRIVSILDEAFDGIAVAKANAEKNVENARALFESYLQNMFANPGHDWEERKLGQLARIELGKTPTRASSALWDEKRGTGNIWLSIADLLNSRNNIVVDSREYISDKGAAVCKLVPKGTLLVSFKLTLGRLAFAGCDLYTNEAIAALTLLNEHELSKEYLFWFLQFFDWVKAAENDVKLKGMTMNKAKLKEIGVRFPKPLSEQRSIVSRLDCLSEETRRLESLYQQKLTALEELKRSLLHQAFNGEL